MEWIVVYENKSQSEDGESEKYILFEYGDYGDETPRKWQISINYDLSDEEIENTINKRISELLEDIENFGNLDSSDLFVDYTKKDNGEWQ
jgi:hypothetical protein